jgi:hypothetical protein
MIITYDNSQDDGTILLPSPTLAFSGFSIQSSITNITNKSFTININLDLTDVTETITEYGFELYNGVNLVDTIGLEHRYVIGESEYAYKYRVWNNLEKNQTYNILPYIQIYGDASKKYGNLENVILFIANDLSLHTDMSYADIRDLDLSSNGLNMDMVNFYNCMVDENTIFYKNPTGLDIKHYYDYDISSVDFSVTNRDAPNYDFSVANGDNPNYDFTTIINVPTHSTSVKNNLKLVRIRQLFRTQNKNMILVKKEFLGLADNSPVYYSKHIGLLNPSIDNFILTDYIYPNGSKLSFCYKLITKNFNLSNQIDIEFNQTTELLLDYNDSYRIMQKNNELFWFEKVPFEFVCMNSPLERLTGIDLMFKTSFMSNLEDLDTSGLKFLINYNGIDNEVIYNELTSISYTSFKLPTAGTVFFIITPMSFSKYSYLFETHVASIDVIENINEINIITPIINAIVKNTTNRSTTLGCDIIVSAGMIISEIGMYISTTALPKNGTHYVLEKNGVLLTRSRTAMYQNIKRTIKRIYPLLKNTIYHVVVYAVYTINSVNTTVETPIFEFTTEPAVFNISGIDDLSYADLTQTDSSLITDNIDLTRAITSTGTPFPITKKYFDYTQTMLDELIDTDGTNDNTNRFTGIVETVTKNTIRKFLIAQYFINNDNNPDFGIVTNKFLGLSQTSTPLIKIVNQTTRVLSIYDTGSLKQTVLYKHMDENDEFELLEGDNSLKIQGPSGLSKEYFFYKNNVLVQKEDGIYTSGSVVDCFNTFNMLNGYIITLNSVEVSEYIYATLSGTTEAYYGDTITYTIRLDTITYHDLTFTLSNGKQIKILSGYTTGSVNTQLLAVQNVSITNVSGGQSHRVKYSGTVTCNIINIIATLSTYNTTAYYGEQITYSVTLSYPTSSLLTFTIIDLPENITIQVPINQKSGSVMVNILEDKIGKTLLNVSGDGSLFVTLLGTVSTTIKRINATLSCSNTTAYYGDTITYSVYFDNPHLYVLIFKILWDDIGFNIVSVSPGKRIGSVNLTITKNKIGTLSPSTIGSGMSFINLLGTVSTSITYINATLSCSNTTAYYGDTITYIVTLDNPTNSLLTFVLDNNITINVPINQTTGSSDIIISEVRNNKTISSVTGDGSNFVNKLGSVSTGITYINANLSCSNTTAYYGDTITYTVTLDHPTNNDLEFILGDTKIYVDKNQTIGSSTTIITASTENARPSFPIEDVYKFITFPENNSVSTTITNINATLSCSNTTAYYGETITYTVTLDHPTNKDLEFELVNGIKITVLETNLVGSSTSVITENIIDQSIINVSGEGRAFVNKIGSVSIIVNKEILIENHHSGGEIVINNVTICQDTEEDQEIVWQDSSEKIIDHLRELPKKIKSKLPTKGLYSLGEISEVLGSSIQYNYESDVSYIHVKPSHISCNKALFHITVRNILDATVQMTVSNVSNNIVGALIAPAENNFIYGIDSETLQPNTTYDYSMKLFKNGIVSDTVTGTFKTEELCTINDVNISEAMTDKIKNINNTIHLKYYYTINQNVKTITCMYKCFSSNILTSISDTISWEGTYEVPRFSNELIKYPLNNKVVEFNVVSGNGIYRDVKKVKIHYEDRKIGSDPQQFHILEFIS